MNVKKEFAANEKRGGEQEATIDRLKNKIEKLEYNDRKHASLKAQMRLMLW